MQHPKHPSNDPPVYTTLKTTKAKLGGTTTLLAIVDIESWGRAGFKYDKDLKKWVNLYGKVGQRNDPNPLVYCGADAYAAHPDTEVLCISYSLPDGKGVRRYVQGEEIPEDLRLYLESDLPIGAFNVGFECPMFYHIMHLRLGWPYVSPHRWRCMQIQSHMVALHRSLGGVCAQLQFKQGKDDEGRKEMLFFCTLHNPNAQGEPSPRVYLEDHPERAAKLFKYSDMDVLVTEKLNKWLPDLSPEEQRTASIVLQMNQDGIKIDRQPMTRIFELSQEAITDLDKHLVSLYSEVNPELKSINQTKVIRQQLGDDGIILPNIQAATLRDALEGIANLNPPPHPRALKLIELRLSVSSPALSKSRAAKYRMCSDDRIRGATVYHGAISGRKKSEGFQLHNLPSKEPFKTCHQCTACLAYFLLTIKQCPDCQSDAVKVVGWSHEIPEYILQLISRDNSSLASLEAQLGPALPLLSISLRSCIMAGEGNELIVSDYKAIEAVMAAFVSGQQWMMDVFSEEGGGHIYEVQGARSAGITLEEMLAYRKETGKHHPARLIGKTLTMSMIYLGGVRAAQKVPGGESFSAEFLSVEVEKWRQGAPQIVDLAHKFFAAAVKAVNEKGTLVEHAGVKFRYWEDSLLIRYPSGRRIRFREAAIGYNSEGHEVIHYQDMRTAVFPNKVEEFGKPQLIAVIIQGMARDVLTYAMTNIADAGLRIAMTVHDEIVVEAPIGTCSVERLESLMNQLPPWAATDGKPWPIFSAGGWHGLRYRK